MRVRRGWLIGLTVLLCAVSATAFAAPETFQGLPIVNVLVNGKPLVGDAPGVLLAGRTMLPLRNVAEAVGAKVEWDQQTTTAILTTTDISKVTKERDEARNELAKVQSQLAEATAEIARLKAQLEAKAPPNTPPAISREAVQLLTYNVRKNSFGESWAYVEFRNNGNTAVEEVEVSMLATKAGVIAATGTGSLGFAVLRPGETASVWVKPSNEVPSEATVEWTFSSKPSTREVPRLTVNSSAVTKGDFGWAHGIGSISNADTRPVESIRVIVAFYDANGKILYSSENTDVALRNLAPGKTTVFDATAVDIGYASVAEVKVYVTAVYGR